jgi:hypothetical protein
MAGDIKERASAGHKLGQLVGDWFEQFFVLPLLEQAATRLDLYLDHRFRERPARGEKIVWHDDEGNAVDYDFVMELDGTRETLGVPVAFVECFWRRGSRHSKDKARDDAGKLVPMRDTYPTARFVGIVGGGDFTGPAKQFIQCRGIDLFYVPKAKIVAAFDAVGLQMDYPDRASEEAKAQLADVFQRGLVQPAKVKAATSLQGLLGPASIAGYVNRVHAALSALPQEFSFTAQRHSAPRVFESITEAAAFLEHPDFDFSSPTESFAYHVVYTDGSEFDRQVPTIGDLRALHRDIERLAQHMNRLQTQR